MNRYSSRRDFCLEAGTSETVRARIGVARRRLPAFQTADRRLENFDLQRMAGSGVAGMFAAAVAADHQPLERIRRSLEVHQQSIVKDGLDPTRATIIRLAVDGIVYARALGIDVLDKQTSQNVYEELIRLTVAT